MPKNTVSQRRALIFYYKATKEARKWESDIFRVFWGSFDVELLSVCRRALLHLSLCQNSFLLPLSFVTVKMVCIKMLQLLV